MRNSEDSQSSCILNLEGSSPMGLQKCVLFPCMSCGPTRHTLVGENARAVFNPSPSLFENHPTTNLVENLLAMIGLID